MSEKVYYSLPSVVNVFLPIIQFPEEFQKLVNGPIPDPIQQIHTFAWLLSPLVTFVFGSYCLDSKNSFCFFPGAPYFYRVLQCNLLEEERPGDSRKQELKTVRDWVLQHNPPMNKSSHYWYHQLPAEVRATMR